MDSLNDTKPTWRVKLEGTAEQLDRTYNVFTYAILFALWSGGK